MQEAAAPKLKSLASQSGKMFASSYDLHLMVQLEQKTKQKQQQSKRNSTKCFLCPPLYGKPRPSTAGICLLEGNPPSCISLYSNLKDFHSPIKDYTRAVGCRTTNLLPQANPQICPAALRQRGQKLAPTFSLPATKGAKASPLVSKGILKAPNRFPKK